jgi:protein ImuA
MPTHLLLHKALAASPAEGPARLADLSRLAPAVARALWWATDLHRAEIEAVPTGFAALDAELPGGGWPCRSLTELLQPQPSLCEWRLLAPGLKALVRGGGHLLLVGPPKRPHAPGLAQLGLPAQSLVWFAADTPSERLWTTEQLIGANPRGAILAWLPQARPEQLRRLQVHAQSCDCPVFVFRAEQARREASPAPLRLVATFGLDWELHVQILKRRGSPHEGILTLPSIPGILAEVLTPRLLRPSQLMMLRNANHVNALGRAAEPTARRHLARH